ncbi:MAG: 23S rRNA (adenine(2503)-C(2))-methyltransferase RlmN [Candidatus Berkelbacteria bacterium]
MTTDFYQYLESMTSLRRKQMKTAIFVNLIDQVSEITTLSKFEREKISSELEITPFTLEKEQKSTDGSTKWALKLADGHIIETVLLEFRDGRNTVCISSQVGCASGCLFCATGQLGFTRNLTSWEIVSQVLFAARYLKKKKAEDFRLTNVVFMGMGEPLLNLDNVLFAIKELNDPDYFNLGRRHMTVSTCGVINNLQKFIEADTGTTLAISLHAPNQALREKLMPIARAHPLDQLIKTLDNFVRQTKKRVSYEYLLLDGINDSEKEANELVSLFRQRLVFINLITFNPIGSTNFKPTPRDRADRFKSILEKNNIPVTVRVSLGDEISAACGQLAGEK